MGSSRTQLSAATVTEYHATISAANIIKKEIRANCTGEGNSIHLVRALISTMASTFSQQLQRRVVASHSDVVRDDLLGSLSFGAHAILPILTDLDMTYRTPLRLVNIFDVIFHLELFDIFKSPPFNPSVFL